MFASTGSSRGTDTVRTILTRPPSGDSGAGLAERRPSAPGSQDRVGGRQVQPAGPPLVPSTGESPVDRAAKRELVTTLNGVFTDTSVVVVAHYKGLTVAD